MTTKICTECKADLPLEAFHKRNKAVVHLTKSNTQSRCRPCTIKRNTQYLKERRWKESRAHVGLKKYINYMNREGAAE